MTSFSLPPYPYDRLDDLKAVAASHEGGIVDLSIGTPFDPTPPEVVAALSSSGAGRGYPPSVGSARFRDAAAAWMRRRLGVEVPPDSVGACVGTKELVATIPLWLRLRAPDRDTVLYPAVAYPTYEMGALISGCRPIAVPVDQNWRLDLSAVDDADAERALCLWINSPANPTGCVDDLAAIVDWARRRGIPVFSDECYIEFTWGGPPRTVLEHGLDGVVALHSLSKRSNMAGLRAGFYAGDPDLVGYLREGRKHAGLMMPGPVQAAAAVALDDDDHVEAQRARYLQRLEYFAEVLTGAGAVAGVPEGSFYIWAAAPGGDAWKFTALLAERGGVLVSPGDLYGDDGQGFVRVALVQPMDRLELVAQRLEGLRSDLE